MNTSSPIRSAFRLDAQWPIQDPFLFCAYHLDHYPSANGQYGPATDLTGRNIGQDFVIKNGFRMYHGDSVPGFPLHPHRGFETITLVRQGFVDHADSLGAAGRYSAGDVQWMTAGAGIQHSEMFPLLDEHEDNTLELLQIWINLPRANKLVPPGYEMYWAEDIPTLFLDEGRVKVEVIAGRFDESEALPPPQASWAANPESEVALWLVSMEPGASMTLPPASESVNRSVFFYRGDKLQLQGTELPVQTGLVIDPGQSVELLNGKQSADMLVMQGRPIGEPVAQYGPFVMNTEDDIRQAVAEYQRTQFGQWPWPRNDMVHGPEKRRFGRQSDGQEYTRTTSDG